MKILVVEPDESARLLARHTLQSFHHWPLTADSVASAGALLRDEEPEAIVLASTVVGQASSGIRQVMSLLGGGRALPVLLLTESDDPLGNADVPTLEKPFAPEAFLARLEQTLTERPEMPGWETGVITGNQLLEVLQELETMARTGIMRITGDRRNGLVEVYGGRIVAARYGLLQGCDAMLSMMQLLAAFYSFEDAPLPEPDQHQGEGLDLAELTLAMARLEGELVRRGPHLPKVEQPLFAVEGAQPERPRDMAPTAALCERIRFLPGITLEEILAQEIAPPLKIRLALALLVARGAVTAEA